MAEWLGEGLQSLSDRFDSYSVLIIRKDSRVQPHGYGFDSCHTHLIFEIFLFNFYKK